MTEGEPQVQASAVESHEEGARTEATPVDAAKPDLGQPDAGPEGELQAEAQPAETAGDTAHQTSETAHMKWYVLRVASNREESVREALRRKITIEGLERYVGRVLVPTVPEKRMRAGVLKIMQRKLYPGYVFVEMACQEDGTVADNVWFLIKETGGVGDFIGSDSKPTSMPDHEARQMLAVAEKSEEEPSISGLNIKPGDQVKITDGAFESFEGEVEAVDERRGMVSVSVAIFGRLTPIEVGYWELEKVE